MGYSEDCQIMIAPGVGQANSANVVGEGEEDVKLFRKGRGEQKVYANILRTAWRQVCIFLRFVKIMLSWTPFAELMECDDFTALVVHGGSD